LENIKRFKRYYIEMNIIRILRLKVGIENNVDKVILASSAAAYGDNQAVAK